eukprot:6551205-Prymnesium_polylepis.1
MTSATVLRNHAVSRQECGVSRRHWVARPKRPLALHVDQYQIAPIVYTVGVEYPATSGPRGPKESGSVTRLDAVPEMKQERSRGALG